MLQNIVIKYYLDSVKKSIYIWNVIINNIELQANYHHQVTSSVPKEGLAMCYPGVIGETHKKLFYITSDAQS